MDELARKINGIDWNKLQRQAKKVQASTASAMKDLVMTDLENKVRAACADTTWGASGSDLMQIAQGTFAREDYALIMSIVWQRLGSSRWRCVYKALEVLKHCCMHGSSRCLEDARSAVHHIQTLEHYRYIDPATHRDDGENVRARAKLVVAMISDPHLMDEEREKDKALRAKLGIGSGFSNQSGGMSSSDYRYGFGSSGPSGSALHTSYSGGSGGGGGGGSSGRGGGSSDRYDYGGTGKKSGGARPSSYDDGGGYDDEPRGAFGALARQAAAGEPASSVQQSVDDLLGDDNGGIAGGDDDDDDFNPRGGGASGSGAKSGVGDLESMVGDISLNGNGQLAAFNGAAPATGKSKSQMIMDLARQSGAQPTAMTVSDAAAPSAKPTSPSFEDLFGPAPNGSAEASAPNATARPATAPKPLRQEKDPFADLKFL